MNEKRLKWAKQVCDDEDFWKSACFSDESTCKILANKAQFVRRRRGEKFHSDSIVQTVKHRTQVVIWSVITSKGTGRLYVVNGIVRQDVLDEDQERSVGQSVVAAGQRMVSEYVFMQDGAPYHTTRSVKTYLLEQNIPLLDWPSNGPNVNPIENVWELMTREVAQEVITTKTAAKRKNHPFVESASPSAGDRAVLHRNRVEFRHNCLNNNK